MNESEVFNCFFWFNDRSDAYWPRGSFIFEGRGGTCRFSFVSRGPPPYRRWRPHPFARRRLQFNPYRKLKKKRTKIDSMATSSTEGGPWTPREVVCRKSWLFEPNRTRMRAPLGRGGGRGPPRGPRGTPFRRSHRVEPTRSWKTPDQFFFLFFWEGGPWTPLGGAASVINVGDGRVGNGPAHFWRWRTFLFLSSVSIFRFFF